MSTLRSLGSPTLTRRSCPAFGSLPVEESVPLSLLEPFPLSLFLTRLVSLPFFHPQALWQADFLTNHSLECLQIIVLSGLYLVRSQLLVSSSRSTFCMSLISSVSLHLSLDIEQPRPRRCLLRHPRFRHQDRSDDGHQPTRRRGRKHRGAEVGGEVAVADY